MLQFLAEMSVLIGFCPGFPCLTPFESHLSQEIPIPSWSLYILFSLQTKSIKHKSRTKSEHIAILKEDLDVSWNGGTPKSFISIGFSIINYPLLGTFILGNPHFQPFPCSVSVSGHRYPEDLRGSAAAPQSWDSWSPRGLKSSGSVRLVMGETLEKTHGYVWKWGIPPMK